MDSRDGRTLLGETGARMKTAQYDDDTESSRYLTKKRKRENKKSDFEIQEKIVGNSIDYNTMSSRLAHATLFGILNLRVESFVRHQRCCC